MLCNSVHETELLRLNFVDSYSLPVLAYCIGVIKSSKVKLKKINACIFGFNRQEFVRTF